MFTIAILVVVIGGALILNEARVARANRANLGWMSEQWLSEHRASTPS
jgi:hypothetical protein